MYEEIERVIKVNRLADRAAYQNFNRRGRKIGLKQPARDAIWDIYEAVQNWQQETANLTWNDVPVRALKMALTYLTHPTPGRDTPVREEVAEQSYLAGLAAFLGARWIVVLGAYWDASASMHGDAFSIAGYVFTRDAADKFAGRWREVLNSAGLDWFHMSDFVAKRFEPYSLWDEEYRVELFRSLSEIIHDTITFQISVKMNRWIFLELSEDDKQVLDEYDHYSIAGIYFFTVVQSIIGNDEPIAYIFDQGDPPPGPALVDNEFRHEQNCGRINGGSTMTRGDSRHHLELQASDILAHQSAHQYSYDLWFPWRTGINRWSTMLFSGIRPEQRIDIRLDEGLLRDFLDKGREQGGYRAITKTPPRKRQRHR